MADSNKKPTQIAALELQVEIVDVQSMDTLVGKETATTEERALALNDVIEGTVLSANKARMVLDLDGMASGVITGEDLHDSARTVESAEPGDRVHAMIIGMENAEGQYRMSLKRASRQTTWQRFLDAFKAEEVVDVPIIDANKGGLLVEENGIRGFIPVSQLSPENYPRVNGADAARILARLQKLVGTRMKTKILNIDYAEERLIFSEREAYAGDRMKVIGDLKVGSTVKATVSGVVNFGIFVNYDGIEGLVHISEIAWGHVSNPFNYCKQGDEIDVMVIGIEGEKVSFSMKRLLEDPWLEATKGLTVGDIVTGPVMRMTPFGVFIEVKEGVEGLIHVSELSEDHVNDPLDVVKLADKIEAKIILIDTTEHRLGLSVKALTAPVEEVVAEASKEKVAEEVTEENAPAEKKATKAKKEDAEATEEVVEEVKEESKEEAAEEVKEEADDSKEATEKAAE